MDNELILFDRVNAIRDFINSKGEDKVYLSFSGGKDSTVLHHLIDEALPNNNIPRVYINTGIEYWDIVNFVKELAKQDKRIQIVNSGINIKNMLEEKGYPFKSKEHSNKLYRYHLNNKKITKYVQRYLDGVNYDGSKTKYVCPQILKQQFTEDYPIKISDRCCFELKKKPAHKWQIENNKPITITGMRSQEGGQRTYIGCITNNGTKFHPLIKVDEEWENWYIQTRNIELCKLYYPPYNFQRTGCKGCPYSLTLQEQLDTMNSFDEFKAERQQCEAIWQPIYQEYRRIGYRLKKYDQTKLL